MLIFISSCKPPLIWALELILVLLLVSSVILWYLLVSILIGTGLAAQCSISSIYRTEAPIITDRRKSLSNIIKSIVSMYLVHKLGRWTFHKEVNNDKKKSTILMSEETNKIFVKTYHTCTVVHLYGYILAVYMYTNIYSVKGLTYRSTCIACSMQRVHSCDYCDTSSSIQIHSKVIRATTILYTAVLIIIACKYRYLINYYRMICQFDSSYVDLAFMTPQWGGNVTWIINLWNEAEMSLKL